LTLVNVTIENDVRNPTFGDGGVANESLGSDEEHEELIGDENNVLCE
jgi:hypothetical protein